MRTRHDNAYRRLKKFDDDNGDSRNIKYAGGRTMGGIDNNPTSIFDSAQSNCRFLWIMRRIRELTSLLTPQSDAI